MSQLERALAAAARGFRVFPLALRDGKWRPAFTGFPSMATTNVQVIRAWWEGKWQDSPVAISTDGLLVVDMDAHKGGKITVFSWELAGRELPPTAGQDTPHGGHHHIYRAVHEVCCSVEKLGKGVDIRGYHGFIRLYDLQPGLIELAPAWLQEECEVVRERSSNVAVHTAGDALPTTLDRAWEFLRRAPVAVEGEGGDSTTYRVACELRDFGLSEGEALGAMSLQWNARCQPPWDPLELREKVRHAFTYARDTPGNAAPEKDFVEQPAPEGEEEVGNPIAQLNKEFFFTTIGGRARVLQEGRDARGRFDLKRYPLPDWLHKLGPMKGWGSKWLVHPQRRVYEGLCFAPGKTAPAQYYNQWRGFTVEPASLATPEAVEAVVTFRTHLFENLCHSDQKLYDWLMGWFAHMIQRPWEKPRTAVVLRSSGKGVGKNIVAEIIGSLFGIHYGLTSSTRYLTGNFNAHLENKILFVFDEAFWSGDKSAEGALKDLITGQDTLVEPKGSEAHEVKSCVRVMILGNEPSVVAASRDERRFTVLEVGEGWKQNQTRFARMKAGMEAGGYAHLLFVLQDPKLLENVDVFTAPATEGLLDQKLRSQPLLEQFWIDSLHEGHVLHTAEEGWPGTIEKEVLRAGLQRYVRERNARERMPDARDIGKRLKRLSPSLAATTARRPGQSGTVNVYRLPPLDVARKELEEYLGQAVGWE